MKTLCLLLTSDTGDEIGRLSVAGIEVPDAGEAGPTPVRSQLRTQMEQVIRAIEACLSAEGLQTTLEPLDMQIAVSRALLAPGEDPEILVPLPIQDSSDVLASGPDAPTAASVPSLPAWDDLFTLDKEDEEGGKGYAHPSGTN